MKTKILAEGKYVISSVLKGGKCPVVESPLCTDSNYSSSFSKLIDVIQRIAANGFQNIPASLSHAVNSKPKIFEIIRGDLRLFYFHGDKNRIVVCTELITKKTPKVDKKVVKRAITAYEDYYSSLEMGTLIELGEDDESCDE